MKRLAALAVLLFAASAAYAQTTPDATPTPTPPPEKRPQPNGLIVELRFGGGLSAVVGGATAGPSGAVVAGVSPIPSLTVGARLANRIHIGLGFAFLRVAVDLPGMNTQAFNLFYFAPEFAIDLTRSRDNRASFYAKAALPIGADISATSGAPSSDGFVIGYDLGVGLRYALHPAIALGLEAGLMGTFINPERNSLDAFVTTFYSSLVGTFFFGGR
jgi:hypothetical protein